MAFDSNLFLSLTGDDHVRDPEPDVNTRPAAIPDSAYDLIRARIGALDDEHTVYALDICMTLRPSDFLPCLVDFLEDDEAAVCCAARRMLKNSPTIPLPPQVQAAIAALSNGQSLHPRCPHGGQDRDGDQRIFSRRLRRELRG